MYCPECGTKNDDEALFCEECGASLAEYREENESVPEAETFSQPEPQPVFTEGQPTFSEPQPMFQEPQPPGKKKPLSKMAAVLGVEAVLAAVLLTGTFVTMNKKCSPEKVAENYWRAVNECRWSEAYDYCSFPESDMLSKQMYVDAHSNDEKGPKYSVVKVRRQGMAGKTDKNMPAQEYVVEAMRVGSAERESASLQLVKDGKKFIFWNQWKVVPEGEYAKKVEFYLPDGAKMKLNGLKVKGENEFQIPYLFCGTYQMEVKADGMETYRSNIYVSPEGSSESQIVLLPSEETKQQIAEQAGEDLKKILECAINGNDFSAVKEYFSEETLNNKNVKSDYDDMVKRLRENTRVKSFGMSDMKVTFDYMDVDELNLGIRLQIETTKAGYWDGRLETGTDEIERHLTYRREGEGWKLTKMPISVYDIL